MSFTAACPTCGQQHTMKSGTAATTVKCRCGSKFTTLPQQDPDTMFRPGIPIPSAEIPDRKPLLSWPGKWGFLLAICGGAVVTVGLLQAMGVEGIRLQEPYAGISATLFLSAILLTVVASFFHIKAVFTVLVIFACTSGAFGAYVLHVRHQMVAPFAGKMSEYCRAQPVPFGKAQPAEGKIIVINANSQQMDDLFYMLPDAMRATAPENVGTIVRVKWSAVEVGEYTVSKKKAFRRDAEVSVFEAKFPYRLLKQKLIEGPHPEPVSSYRAPKRTTDKYGSYPDKEVLNFVLAGAH